MRVEIVYKQRLKDGRSTRLKTMFQTQFNLIFDEIAIVDIIFLKDISLETDSIKKIFSDPVAQNVSINSFTADKMPFKWDFLIEVSYKPGVTDTVALTAKEAINNMFPLNKKRNYQIYTARQYLFKINNIDVISETEKKAVFMFLHNNLIEKAIMIEKTEWEEGKRPPELYTGNVPESSMEVITYNLTALSQKELKELSRKRLLALSVPEMEAIQIEFKRPEYIERRKKAGLSAHITDVELEMLAQTWSEHCKHKIFNATIHYSDNGKKQVIKSLFNTYIKKTTDMLSKKKDYLKSVFHDNSGVIQFDKNHCICFKVETHNSPSALDPYGGAITGIVGVNRDIMGTGKGAKPIFNTNVLCFGPPHYSNDLIPKGLLHPRRIMGGVHHGIIDGGNQSGIPVVSGAFLFDESFLGKPLVYCGTGGILPSTINEEESWIKHIDPGDLAVMVGGYIGKDGIHGATFSSQPLDEESPTSAVQIGDPITQKKMLDFLLEAREAGLYKGITDNGAGGLSSSLGEMAEYCGGVRIELGKCPLKYSGLAPWEILVSESQERMSLSVPKDKIEDFMLLAQRRDVEATVVGEFTDTGFVEVLYDKKYVGLLSLDFLHNGLPEMVVKAAWQTPASGVIQIPADRNIKEDILSLLSEPNIASKEELVRQYDHEVQAMSVVKPFVGEKEDGPSDGAVLRPVFTSFKGLTVTHGICPRYSVWDTYHMAMCAVDEAYRAHIALGGHPDLASALDNFSWPDPLESENNPDALLKMAQLVRACKGLHDACLSYSIPLISGKDSMKNDAVLEGKKVSVKPTLLISLLGIIPDIRKAMTTDFKQPGDILYALGEIRGELGFSFYEKMVERKLGPCPSVNTGEALPLYRALFKAIRSGCLASCHDISDGGFIVALCESCLSGRLGVKISLDKLKALCKNVSLTIEELLFCETPSRFIVSVRRDKIREFEVFFKGMKAVPIGEVISEKHVKLLKNNASISLSLDEIEKAFKKPI